jgi:putative nucleotidyltransferase with HDIG domain
LDIDLGFLFGVEMENSQDIRAHVSECIPEISWVTDEQTREKILDAYQMALEKSTWKSLKDVPHIFIGEEPKGDMLDHVRAVVQLCRESTRIMKSFGHKIDEQVVLIGAILHDVGKIVEHAQKDGIKVSNKRLRHPLLGAHIALTCGFPDDVVHIIMRHSVEGDIPLPPGYGIGGQLTNLRTMECMIVAYCDHLAAQVRKREWGEKTGSFPLLHPGVPYNS